MVERLIPTIWHNPRCSKSRTALGLLTERGLSPVVRLYLDVPPSRNEIRGALMALGIPAAGLVRWNDVPDGVLDKAASEDAFVDALCANPHLIERPIVFRDGKARIGRPPENILEIL